MVSGSGRSLVVPVQPTSAQTTTDGLVQPEDRERPESDLAVLLVDRAERR